jgi:cyclopropane-fatty-acyl-phospholipid synthase
MTLRHDALATPMGAPQGAPFSWREEMIVRALGRALTPDQVIGRLILTLPSGRQEVYGRSGDDASLMLRSFAPLWRGLTRGALGITECYLDGAIDTPDLGALLRFCLRNTTAVSSVGGSLMRPRLIDRLWHRTRANTRSGSRRNIAAHYDLGNAFYRLWLDPSMTYSSALFTCASQTLEAAQHTKNAAVLEALDVQAGDRVLEIGCGWGGFAQAACERGASVTGLTLSREQLRWAEEKLSRAGFPEQSAIKFQDYRDIAGSFDKIASIEMIEAVGEANWPIYFQTIHDRLVPGGSAVIQGITIDERHFSAYRREPDFIQRYIFPGGMLPTIAIMKAHAAQAGLEFEVLSRFGSSYARTLALWREAFEQAWPQIAEQGFDTRFARMWRYYLTYCEVGFENGDIDVGHYRMKRIS